MRRLQFPPPPTSTHSWQYADPSVTRPWQNPPPPPPASRPLRPHSLPRMQTLLVTRLQISPHPLPALLRPLHSTPVRRLADYNSYCPIQQRRQQLHLVTSQSSPTLEAAVVGGRGRGQLPVPAVPPDVTVSFWHRLKPGNQQSAPFISAAPCHQMMKRCWTVRPTALTVQKQTETDLMMLQLQPTQPDRAEVNSSVPTGTTLTLLQSMPSQ